jgi:hypothetical protein
VAFWLSEAMQNCWLPVRSPDSSSAAIYAEAGYESRLVTVNCFYQTCLVFVALQKATLRMERRPNALRAVILWLIDERGNVMGLHLFRWERGKVGRDVC